MKKRQILWAVMFGAMLAITGCGDDPVDNGGGGSGGTAGSGGMAGSGGSGGTAASGGGGGDFCETLCAACGGSQAECTQTCDEGIGQLPAELACPSQLDDLDSCLGANDCSTQACETEWTAWITCLITSTL